MNCFRQHSPGKTLDVQVFHENLSKLLHQHARQFVVMVITLVVRRAVTYRSEPNLQQVKPPLPAVQPERAHPQLFVKLPRTRQKRTHASRNVQPERKNVSREMVIARSTEEILCRVHHDGYAGEQHDPPKWCC